jgi:site-specific DNA recombinase
MSASGPLRAVIYRRVSTYQQLGGTSPETQLARAKALIAEQRWEIVGDFYDPATSGAKQSRRDLDRLLEMCRAGLVDVVVVGDLSRLSRDLRNSLNFEHELQQLGVQVVDLDNPHAEEHVKQLNYWLGGWQRAQIRKVTHRGVLAVAKAGYWPGGRPPFGWRIVPARDNPERSMVVRDEAEAATIELAVKMVVDEGRSCWDAAGRLNALKRFRRTGARWTAVHLARMLRRDDLAGEWTLHTDSGDFTIHGPQILSPDRMRQVRKVLADRAKGPRGSIRVYPLSGRVTGPCGGAYTGTSRNDRELRQYECHTNHSRFDGTGRRCWCPRVQADWLERTVWAEVAKLLTNPQRLLALADQHLARRPDELRAEATEISDLDRKLTAAKRRRTNLVLAAADSGPEAIADALAKTNADVDTLERMLAQARAWAQANAERSALVRDLEQLAKVAQTRLADPTPEVQREVLAALDVRVELEDKGVRQRRNVIPALRISGMLVGDLAALGGDLGKVANGSRP